MSFDSHVQQGMNGGVNFNMHPKELDLNNEPVASFNPAKMAEQDLDDYGREKGSSFLDMMKQNIPSVARLPSPKPHRKHHHHHHHHKNGSHSPSRPRLGTTFSCVEDSSNNSPFLTVQAEHFRARSYSDGSIRNSECLNRRSKSANVSPLASPSISPMASPKVSPRASPKTSPMPSPKAHRKIPYFRQEETTVDAFGDNDLAATPNKNNTLSAVDLTIVRELITDSDETGQSEGTITRRKAEIIHQIKENEEYAHKKKTMKMIHELIQQCNSNCRSVESDVDFAFTRLHAALESRKKEIIEDAKNRRDKRIENLQQSKLRCIASQSVVSVDYESESSNTPSTSSSRRDSGEQDECLQSNGILEPWKSSNGTDEKAPCDPAPESAGNEKVFSDILDEGNMSFFFSEEKMEMFATLGRLEDTLSSPQYSFTKGLQNGMALSGETVKFEVHTRSKKEEVTHNSKDEITCRVFDNNEENVDVTKSMSLQRCLSNGRTAFASSPHTSLNKFYSYYFTPHNPGKYDIRIYVNNVEIKNSPFKYSVYPKVNLAFDLKSPEEKKDMKDFVMLSHATAEERRQSMIRRQSSEDSDWNDNNWIVQKGDKSTLLRSVTNDPSYIYAAPAVSGFCAWKLRVTSACESIVVSIGVGTRSGIPDIDEHFACEFNCSTKNKSSKRSSNVSNGNNRMQVRKSSSFNRIMLMYDVLLSTDEGVVRVISESDDESKIANIDPKVLKQFELYPFVSMVHRHDICPRQVCPRPQITLL